MYVCMYVCMYVVRIDIVCKIIINENDFKQCGPGAHCSAFRLNTLQCHTHISVLGERAGMLHEFLTTHGMGTC